MGRTCAVTMAREIVVRMGRRIRVVEAVVRCGGRGLGEVGSGVG